VVADVMMPRLDGFGLLRELRGDPATRTIPVILLSARAGEEARVEGLAAGADDYVVKPFSARELVARVGGALELARVRREAAERERAARAEAEKANRVKGEFLAMMSHELRTPLNAILGFSDLLDAEVAGPLGPVQREHLGRIRASARHLTQIIEEILTFSRIEAGEEVVHAENVDVANLVHDTAAIIEPFARAQGLRLLVEAPAGRPTMVSDGGKLRQILLNLLSNAVKFTPAGEVWLAASVDGDRIAFTVSDTGVGIPADQLELVFEPFRQVDRRGGALGGTGLGLAVCRHLARLLGGDIAVESTPGAGSTFRVSLPVRAPRATVAPLPVIG
jgi:signal transduction histidine kinase